MNYCNRGLIYLGIALLFGCGGGGSEPANSVAAVDPLAYSVGVYPPAAQYEARCAAPRTGIDPETLAAYPDKAGSVAYENFWLRSWSNDVYLWYDELPDLNPNLYSSNTDYFDRLKTDAVTPSGNPRDQFHYAIPTDEWRDTIGGNAAAGYGMQLVSLRSSPPREFRIAYIVADSPAAAANLRRGDRLLSVDGIDLVNTVDAAEIDALNAALTPATINQSHRFEFSAYSSAASNVFELRSADVAASPVPLAKLFQHNGVRIGYVLFNDHFATAEQQLAAVVQILSDYRATELVLDLRYNGGGYLAIAAQLAYMIAGSSSAGKTFEVSVYNDKHTNIDPFTNRRISPVPFIDETIGFSLDEGEPLPSLSLSRVVILSGASTCSASEAIINGLRGIDFEVVLVGGQTCGKPYGFVPTDNCGTTYLSVNFRGENAKGFGDYADGFVPWDAPINLGEPVPGCSVGDDFSADLGDPGEARLAAALNWINSGSCATTVAPVTTNYDVSATPPAIALKPIWLQQRIMH